MQGKLIDELINSLWLMSSELVVYIEKKIKPLGLTVQDLRAVVVLGEHGPMSPSDLAAALGVSNSAATGIVNRLRAARVAQRDIPATDKRKRVITLQYSELDAVLMEVATIARIFFKGYTSKEIQTIQQYHHDVLHILQQAKQEDSDSDSSKVRPYV